MDVRAREYVRVWVSLNQVEVALHICCHSLFHTPFNNLRTYPISVNRGRSSNAQAAEGVTPFRQIKAFIVDYTSLADMCND